MTGGVGHVPIAVSVNHYMNIYETMHRASCPNGNLTDTYQIKITSHDCIMVENIKDLLFKCEGKIYQESLADYLRAQLGAKIEIIGWHHGVKVTCVRE